LTDVYKLYGDTLDGVVDKTQKMEFIAGLLIKATDPNVATVTELTHAFEKFASTATNVGLTLQQSLALLSSLHTLGIRGSIAGDALTKTFIYMTTKVSETRSLFQRFSQEMPENIFERYIKLVQLIDQLPKSQKIPVIEQIFGIKGLKATASFSKLVTGLKETMVILADGTLDVAGTIYATGAITGNLTGNATTASNGNFTQDLGAATLATITAGTNGSICTVIATSDSAIVNETGNIILNGATTFDMDTGDVLTLVADGASWREIGRSFAF